MKKNINVNLIEIPEDKHEMYEMGISFDRVYRIDNENEIPIGIVNVVNASIMTSKIKPNSWVLFF